jgi:hypothetical protein
MLLNVGCYVQFFLMKIPGGRTFVSASIANTVKDGIERFCGRIFTANSATSGVAAIKSVCSKCGYIPIFTVGLYIYYPIFDVHFFVFKEFFSKKIVLMYG